MVIPLKRRRPGIEPAQLNAFGDNITEYYPSIGALYVCPLRGFLESVRRHLAMLIQGTT